MKRITSLVLPIALMLSAPAFFTACQEDAPEINYTMNVQVVNDFTKVVEAINNGSLKNEEALRKLIEAIDKMNADQQTKLQAVVDVLNSVNTTLDAKLAALEAALRAQTLSLEGKLALLETAINNQTVKQEELADKLTTAIDNLGTNLGAKLDAIKGIIESTSATTAEKLALIEAAIRAQTLSLEGKLDLLKTAINNLPDYSAKLDAIKTAIEGLPDYSDKLDAIKTAIAALPDYSDKFDALVKSLDAIKAQLEAVGKGGQAIADAIAEVQKEIVKLTAEVKSGNTSAAAALAQLIAKLDEIKAMLGNGEASPQFSYITLTTANSTGIKMTFFFDKNDVPVVEGATEVGSSFIAGQIQKDYVCDKGTFTIKGKITKFWCTDTNLTALDVSHCPELTFLACPKNKLKELDLSKNLKLEEVGCYNNQLSYATLKLPKVNNAVLRYKNSEDPGETQTLTSSEVTLIKLLGWQVKHKVGGNWDEDYAGE